MQLFASKGEIRLQLSDGACYVLRFGEDTGETSKKADVKARLKMARTTRKTNRLPARIATCSSWPSSIPKP